MQEEIQGVREDTRWRKAIPEARDRLQSRVLVIVVGILLTLETAAIVRSKWGEQNVRDQIIGGISLAFAGLVLSLRAATVSGALFGGMICFVLVSGTVSSQFTIVRSGLAPLALLFVLTFFATRAGRRVKAEMGIAEERHGRSSSQVIANLSIAALAVSGIGSELVACSETPNNKFRLWPAMMM